MRKRGFPLKRADKVASLYDRLKNAQPIRSQPVTYKSERDCLTRSERVSLDDPGSFHVSAEAVSFLSGGETETEYDPEDFLFLDTETTGLSGGAGTLAFLIGLGRIEGESIAVTQILMRDYHQEAEMIRGFLQHAQKAKCLVTYNGAGFDLPLLQGRMIINRMEDPLSEMGHIDLLYAARRVFKLRLGRCSLSRMEEAVFRETRKDDLPGSEVPKRYFEYLNSRDEKLLEQVLDHNRQDIVSLARLFFHMVRMHERPLETEHQEDLFSMGKVYERQRQHDRARECYQACSENSVRDIARLRLAEMYRKNRMDEEAVHEYEALRSGRSVNGRVYIALAKIYEHRFRKPARALEIARQGMIYCSERIALSDTAREDFMDLEHRSQRLMRKVERLHDDNTGQTQDQERAAQTPERPEGRGPGNL